MCGCTETPELHVANSLCFCEVVSQASGRAARTPALCSVVLEFTSFCQMALSELSEMKIHLPGATLCSAVLLLLTAVPL